jgi:hypothetical protein
MAIIKGRTVSFMYEGKPTETYHDLEIFPIPPSYDGPRDAYRVAIWRNDEKVFEQTHSVHTATDGYIAMWHLANILQHAPEMVDLPNRLKPARQRPGK